MKLNLRLQQKIQLIIISISVVIFLGTIVFISLKTKSIAYRDATRMVDAQSQKYAYKIESLISKDFSVVSTLSQAFKNYDFLPKEKWQKLINKMYDEVFLANPSFYNLWDSWELSSIDSTYTKPYGRIVNQHFRENNVMKTTQGYRSMEGDPELYAKWKAKRKNMIADLYADVFVEHKKERKLMTTLVSPILVESGEYIGLIGVDLTLTRFQKIVNNIQIKTLDGSYAFLISHDKKYAGHPNTELLNQKPKKNPTKKENFNLFDKMEEGNHFSIIHDNKEEKKRYVSYAPIKIGDTETNWYLGITTPIGSIKEQANKNFLISMLVGVLGISLLSLVIYFVTKNISNPIEKVTNRLGELSKGRIDENMKLQLSTGDELEEMANALNTSIDELNKKNEFAQNLGTGKLDYQFQASGKEDELGHSLLEMRESLQKAREEEEKRKIEDEKRRWVNEGLAKFADILRQNNENLEQLSYEIIRNLVEYLEANQGGIFVLNDEDKDNIVYELKAAYAFDRRKYLEKQIKPGESLVGTCAIEKETIYMTDLPQDYIKITSGLGDANPDSILIVPLKMEENVLGVVEIASFNKFEDYQIEFVEKLGETIASTLSSVRTNLRTSELLEKSQQQAEEMSAQEEEMRQNMEELKATQEESARREQELKGMVEAIDNFLLKAETNTEGELITGNDLFLNTFGYNKNEISEKNIESLIHKDEVAEFRKMWNKVLQGNDQSKVIKAITKENEALWLISSLTPIRDKEDNIIKVLYIGLDHTDSEKEKIKLKEQIQKNK